MEKELINNSQSNIYPFHMPGHKRRGSDIGEGLDPYAIDITEIDNFDNLHHAEGIIKEAQAEAAALYGAKRAYFLITEAPAVYWQQYLRPPKGETRCL